MPRENATLSREFLAQQRGRLEALRAQILEGEEKTTTAERASREDRGAEQQDPGEKSTNIAQREIDQGLHNVDKRRLNDIERAIEKMEEGTYGLSDFSGKPIPMARLEATPEAFLTVQEEVRREKTNFR